MINVRSELTRSVYRMSNGAAISMVKEGNYHLVSKGAKRHQDNLEKKEAARQARMRR